MEYISGGNMTEELEKVGAFSEERAWFYAAEVTLALELSTDMAFCISRQSCVLYMPLSLIRGAADK